MNEVQSLRYYAGIGARKTPEDIQIKMTNIAEELNSLGYILRSGGAPGADSAFELGAGAQKEIYLPWKEFNDNISDLYSSSEEAEALSRKLFPHFPGASQATRKLVTRNMHQILGQELYVSPPSEFVVCWTPKGRVAGGTGYAIRAANYFDIPIYNLFDDVDYIKLMIYVEDMKKDKCDDNG